jgi:hypothetical protein
LLPTNLYGFTRHAELHGVECVYETAIDYLDEAELEQLAGVLRGIDKKWRVGRQTASILDLRRERNAKGASRPAPKGRVEWAENRSYGPPPALEGQPAEHPTPGAGCFRCDIPIRSFSTTEKARNWAYKHSGSRAHRAALGA